MNKTDLIRFSTEILTAAGADRSEAEIVAGVLVWCDAVGRTTQGVWRLPILIERLKKGLFQSPCKYDLNMVTATLGSVDANNGMAHYVAHQVTQHTIRTAKQEGICAMTVNNSNYYGAGGYYTNLIAEAGMIGIALSNSFPKVIPHGGKSPALGTNPFSFACPALNDEPLLIDMATSELAGSTIRKTQEQGQTDDNLLFPFGGAKGFGLSLFVEILAGVLSGAGISHEVKSMYNNFNEGGNNGHFILAIDIEKFLPLEQFNLRMQNLIRFLRNSNKDANNVQYPGENRWRALRASEQLGITIDASTQQKLQQLADEFGIQFN
ncbi:MAG: Ldh family oxidoreductase [Thiotrichaceae bacterium]|nr:Ldh family oxidoreductase [Thiotrichaceae bacterium]